MDLENFMAATPPSRRRSPLWAHADAIRALLGKRYTLAQIRDFLQQQGVTVSKERINQFATQELGIRRNNTAAEPESPRHITPPTAVKQAQRQHIAPAVVLKPIIHSTEITADQMAEFSRLTRIGQTTKD